MPLAAALSRVRAAVDEPRLLMLLDYWETHLDGDRLPARADIDPVEMRFILGNLILVDIGRDPFSVRYRLVGTNLGNVLGIAMTGRTLDEHPDATFRAVASESYRRVATSGEPEAVRRNTVMDGRMRQYQALMLPLASDGHTVDMIMVGQCFEMDPPFAS